MKHPNKHLFQLEMALFGIKASPKRENHSKLSQNIYFDV